MIEEMSRAKARVRTKWSDAYAYNRKGCIPGNDAFDYWEICSMMRAGEEGGWKNGMVITSGPNESAAWIDAIRFLPAEPKSDPVEEQKKKCADEYCDHKECWDAARSRVRENMNYVRKAWHQEQKDKRAKDAEGVGVEQPEIRRLKEALQASIEKRESLCKQVEELEAALESALSRAERVIV